MKQQTAGALLWNFLDRFGQYVLQFVVMIVVANLLFPEDYALVAMLAVFTAVGNLLIESGFGAALIQRQDVGDRDFSTVFWFNQGMSLFLYALFMACSPLIVGYFGEPRLFGLGAVVFLVLPINASMLIQTTLLNKQIRFKELAAVNITAMIVSSVCAVVMALAGFGVWTLAWQPVILAAAKSVQLWRVSRWRPQRVFDAHVIHRLFGFASNLLLSGLLNTVFLNIYALVLPKLFRRDALGYVTQSAKVCDPVVTLVYGSVQGATYPIFSHIRDNRTRLINAYRKSVRFTSFLIFPLLLGMIAVATPLFHLLFKSAWWPAIPYFRLLCLGGCFTVLTAVNGNFIKVSGRTRIILLIEVAKVVLTAVALLLFHDSALQLVAGIIGVRGAVYLLNLHYVQRCTGYGFFAQLRDTLPYLLIALLMAAASAVWQVVPMGNLLQLAAGILTGALVYGGTAYFSGSKMMKESVQLVLQSVHKRTARTAPPQADEAPRSDEAEE